MTFPPIRIHIWLLISFLPYQLFQNHDKNCCKCVVCARCCTFSRNDKTFWCDNLTGELHELVAIGNLDHLCWVSHSWYFGLGSVVFGGWLGDFRNFIFSKAIETVLCKNMPILGHDLVVIGHLDNLCCVSGY